jgi:2-dehydro-3-deoxyphosphogluconate aldolase/(4S)-4-hydroxy-2-oxoglutarate aldolase
MTVDTDLLDRGGPPSLQALLPGPTVIPVLSIEDPDAAVPLAEALCAGDLPVIEITLRTAAGLEAAQRIATEVPDIILGIGTITTPDQVRAAVDAGARFLVSPGFTPTLCEAALDTGLPFLPGVMTPSEVMLAHQFGLRELKLFPAVPAGGIETLNAYRPVFPEVGFCPTGGIGPANMAAFLSLDNVFAVAGTWVAPARDVAAGRWDQITARARQAWHLAAGACVPAQRR